MLGAILSGQIIGQLFGQAAGGILGDWLGWRAVFFLLAAFFAIAAVALFRELCAIRSRAPATPPPTRLARLRRRLSPPCSLILGARADRLRPSSRRR